MSRIRLRLRGQRGYSLIETLVTMAILGTVMASISGLFVAGTKAEVDMNERFQAQQEARLALSKVRREINCASAVTGIGSANGSGYYTGVTLTLGTYCRTGSGPVSWCAVAVSGTTARYRLYRKAGSSCDATGSRWADYLTSDRLFKPEAPVSHELAKLRVTFPVDLRPADARRSYRLTDSIVLRNSPRAE